MVKAAILEDVKKLKIVDYPEPKVEDAQKSIDTLKAREGIKHALVG